jgi:hypothetical protein
MYDTGEKNSRNIYKKSEYTLKVYKGLQAA